MIYKKALVISVVCIAVTIPLVSLNIAFSSHIQMNFSPHQQVFAQDQEVPFKVQNTSKSTPRLENVIGLSSESYIIEIYDISKAAGRLNRGINTWTKTVSLGVD